MAPRNSILSVFFFFSSPSHSLPWPLFSLRSYTTGGHSKQDQLSLVKIGKYRGVRFYRRSYFIIVPRNRNTSEPGRHGRLLSPLPTTVRALEDVLIARRIHTELFSPRRLASHTPDTCSYYGVEKTNHCAFFFLPVFFLFLFLASTISSTTDPTGSRVEYFFLAKL